MLRSNLIQGLSHLQAFEESEEVEPPSPGWTVKIQVAYQRKPAGWKSVFDTLTRSNYGPGMSRTIRRPRPTIGPQLFLNACSFVSGVQVNGCLHFPNPACHGSSGPLLPQACHVPFIRHSSCGVCGVDLPWFIFIAPGSLPLEGFNSWPPVCASKSPHISGHTASYRFVCLPMLVCLFRCWIHFRIRYCNWIHCGTFQFWTPNGQPIESMNLNWGPQCLLVALQAWFSWNKHNCSRSVLAILVACKMKHSWIMVRLSSIHFDPLHPGQCRTQKVLEGTRRQAPMTSKHHRNS